MIDGADCRVPGLKHAVLGVGVLVGVDDVAAVSPDEVGDVRDDTRLIWTRQE